MNIQEAFPAPRGDFYCRVYQRGQLLQVIDERNLIVNVARRTMARLTGGDVTDRSITQIGFGSSGTEATVEDTALTTPFLKDLESVEYPTDQSVAFNFELATDEANGLEIIEFGLLCANGDLFSRKVRTGPIEKDEDISLSGKWTIYF